MEKWKVISCETNKQKVIICNKSKGTSIWSQNKRINVRGVLMSFGRFDVISKVFRCTVHFPEKQIPPNAIRPIVFI